MGFSHVLLELVVVLGMAALVTVVFQALKLPVVLGYVLAGLLVGPHVPVPLVADPHLVHVLSELGVILLLFTVGLELRISQIAKVGLPAALTAVFEVALVIGVGTMVARLVGFPPTPAFFVGACVGISSTMLVAKAFEAQGWKGGFTDIVYAILVFEDLIAIVLLAVLGGVAKGAGLDAAGLALTIAKLVGFLVVLLVGGLLVVPRAIRWVVARAHRETLVISALAICFGLAAAADAVGYSVALGAFVAGVLVAESGHGHDVFELVRPLRDVFAMVFFVSVGMTIEPAALAREAPLIVAFAAVVLVMKTLGVSLGVFFAGNGVVPGVRAGLALAQIGELSFVIAALAPDGERLLAIAVGVACITTITSPLMIGRSEAIAARVAAGLPERIATFVSFYESWFARLRGRSGRTTWSRLRRSVIVLLVDVGILVAIAIAAATLGPDLLADAGITGWVATAILAGAAILVAAPFGLSSIRRTAMIARRLAAEVIPVGDPVDLGRAPRRVLEVTFELAIALVLAVPVAAAIQPLVPASPLIVIVVALGLVLLMRRSIKDFDGHVRAGSELVLELMTNPDAPGAIPLAQVETILPGFGGTTPIAIDSASPAVGRTLAELDLRAKTGATVLAIGRSEGGGMAPPSATEPLRAGDILALAGAADSIAAARALLA